MTDGMIALDSEQGTALGFTTDRFDGWLWRKGDACIVSFIVSKQPGQGHFSSLLRQIKAAGLRPQIPTPMGAMREILWRKGFRPTSIFDPDMGEDVELWVEERAA